VKSGTRPTEMYHPRLRSIIRSLQLGNIDNMATHARCRHKAAFPKSWLELRPVDRSLLLLLPPPMYARCPRTVERAVQICCHDLSVVVQLAFDGGALGPRDARVRDEDIEASVQVADAGFDSGGDGFEGDDVYLVCFACFPLLSVFITSNKWDVGGLQWNVHTLHSINLLNVLGLFNSFLVAVVPDRDIGACFSQGMCYREPDACSCSRDDGGAAFEGEEREDAVCDGGHGVVVGELSVYYCAVHSGRRFRLRLDVKNWQDSGDVLETVYFLLYAYTSGGGGAREGLYVPDSGSFECRRDHFERSAMNRDVAWNPTIGAVCDLFGHRGTKSLVNTVITSTTRSYRGGIG
jgi:hypothetical protein